LPAVDLATADRIRHGERLAAAVREAGALALGKFRSPLKVWMKGSSSPVCEADIAVNELLQDRLDKAADGFGWLSEESVDDSARMGARQLWVIDPIDGTRAYIAGRPDWSISAALVEQGRPIVAALFAPVTDEMFFAVAGSGATLNGAPIRVSDGTVDGARVAGPAGYLNRLRTIDPRLVATPKIHSLALRFARVAQGGIDAAFASHNSHDWDLAAADLLVHEAGGLLTTFAGKTLIYNRADPIHESLLAAGRNRHVALVDLVRGRRIDS
jgi:myo-inositol-1(or 4)-monophosphatase